MFRKQCSRTGTLLLLWSLFSCARLCAQQSLTPAPQADPSDKATEALQKATQNPVANLISVRLQDNTNFGIGPYDRNQNVLNIQPVIPIHMTENWNLIVRWITPIIWQPAPGTADLQVYGIVENTPAYPKRTEGFHGESVANNSNKSKSPKAARNPIPHVPMNW